MFKVADREKLRARLVEFARRHPEVEAAALLGSAARGEEDRWSDIDLALGLAPGVDPVHAAETWTTVVEQTEPVIDHLDINASGGLYRALLLASTLQVDLSFWPHGHFPTGGSPVQVLFGQPDPPLASVEAEDDLSGHVRMSWLYALHLRSALGRGRLWQALWMLEGIRNQVIALLCVPYGLPAAEGRGVDRLPPAVLSVGTGRDAAEESRYSKHHPQRPTSGPASGPRGRTSDAGRSRRARSGARRAHKRQHSWTDSANVERRPSSRSACGTSPSPSGSFPTGRPLLHLSEPSRCLQHLR